MADHISARQRRLADYSGRPRPLAATASRLGKILGVAGSLATALVGWGVLTAVQGDAVTGLLGAIPGAVTIITTILTAFGIVTRAEPQVTPTSDPRLTVDGPTLVEPSRPGDFGSGLMEPGGLGQ